MTLIPEDIRARLLANGAEITTNDDHIPLIKLVTPSRRMTWLISEIDPERPNHVFALYDLGIHFPALGYVHLDEPSNTIGRLKLRVERDETFSARFPLTVYLMAARQAKTVVEDEAILADVAERIKGTKRWGDA